MEKKDIGTFSILEIETVESADFASAWFFENSEKLETRKYGKDTFSDKYGEVYGWIGKNRNRIRGLSLEQQEKMMIDEGILTRADI